MGPKHGVARGVAVFTSKDSVGSDEVVVALGDDGRLRQWSAAHGVVLNDDAQSLELLDAHVDEWNEDPSHYESVDLGNGVGIYLGNVILNTVAGTRWRVWPNGHPVIALASGRELDVTAMVGDRLMRKGSSLQSIYARASAD